MSMSRFALGTPGQGMPPPVVPLPSSQPLLGSPSLREILAYTGVDVTSELFDYSCDSREQYGSNMAAGVTFTSTIQITQEAFFVAEKLVYFATLSSGTLYLRTKIIINGTDRQLSNREIEVSQMWGTAQRPRIIKPLVIPPKSTITIQGTVLSGSGTIDRLEFTLSGYKVFTDMRSLNLTQG